MAKPPLTDCPTCSGSGRIIDAAALTAYRKKAGVSQRAVAAKMGVSSAFLCDMEKGRRSVPVRMRQFVAAVDAIAKDTGRNIRS